MKHLKTKYIMSIKTIIAIGLLVIGTTTVAQTSKTTEVNMEKLGLTQEWDKTFPQSDKVLHSKVTSATVMVSRLPQICMFPGMSGANLQPLP